ncbi:MAG: Na+/H+ antiporter subunit D [Acidimicrobiia bacterium]
MSVLVTLPIVLPLLAAGLSMVLHRWLAAQRVLSVLTVTAVLAAAGTLTVLVDRRGPQVARMGAWPADIGITLVADRLATIVLAVSAAMVLAVLVYAIGSPAARDDARHFHPVYLVLTAGVAISFLTGDLFNLFVGFEVMLTASYVLITLGGSREQVRAAMSYVVISLVASMLFLTAVAFTYAATGTVNLADLALRLDAIDPEVRRGLGLLFLVVFGIKAAIFPLFFWLPDSYPTAPAPVTAIFAGLLTKVGVYAIIRTQTLLFPSSGASRLLLFVAAATMLIGVLGAIAQNDVKRILSFHIVSQIGYMVFGLALFSLAGLAATIFYIAHHIVVKTTLFLVAGLIEHREGTAALDRLGGLLRRTPLIAGLFLVTGLSLAGIPPFSGFIAKLALVQAGVDAGTYAVVAVSLVVSLLTLYSITKIWAGVFWGDPEVGPFAPAPAGGPAPARPPAPPLPLLMVLPTIALVAVSVAIVVAASPLWGLSERAAADLLNTVPYVEAVLR